MVWSLLDIFVAYCLASVWSWHIQKLILHYTQASWHLKSLETCLFGQQLVQATKKENIIPQHYWTFFLGKSTVTDWPPHNNAKSLSLSWCYCGKIFTETEMIAQTWITRAVVWKLITSKPFSWIIFSFKGHKNLISGLTFWMITSDQAKNY